MLVFYCGLPQVVDAGIDVIPMFWTYPLQYRVVRGPKPCLGIPQDMLARTLRTRQIAASQSAVDRETENHGVGGSIPPLGTIISMGYDIGPLVH